MGGVAGKFLRPLSRRKRRQGIVATFGNELAMEQAIQRLQRIEGVVVRVFDRRTLIVGLKRKDAALGRKAAETIRSSYGYVERDQETLRRVRSEGFSPLDYPIYG